MSEVHVKAREIVPREFLPDPADLAAIARLARDLCPQSSTIPYTYDGERRQLSVFPGGWWDEPK